MAAVTQPRASHAANENQVLTLKHKMFSSFSADLLNEASLSLHSVVSVCPLCCQLCTERTDGSLCPQSDWSRDWLCY